LHFIFQLSSKRSSGTGKRNFRSKRFSRNAEKESSASASHFKAQVQATRTEYSDVEEIDGGGQNEEEVQKSEVRYDNILEYIE
jgi:hypothetical protein